jgi:hypothetical protein
MMLLLFSLAAFAVCVAWLLVLPLFSASQLHKRDRQKALFFILIFIVILPLAAYFFFGF